MENLKDVGTSLQKITQALENYNHIELTDEEREEALRLARKKKHHEIETKKYWERVNAPVVYEKFDYEKTMQYFLHNVSKIVEGFQMHPQIEKVVKLLALYFSGDERFEEQDDFSLTKGIMLVGPVGCGKTTIMKAFARNSVNSYAMVSCRKVADEYTDKNYGGSATIEKYSNLLMTHANLYFGQQFIGHCFDDLGTENVKKHFGNEVDVMENIILNRYDIPEGRGKTHFTANLTGDDIEENYGSRVRSRLREMCNIIEFDLNSPDLRK